MGKEVQTFVKGSYRANTNVRLNSDIDVCVCNKDVFIADYPPGVTHYDAGNAPSDEVFTDFKSEVGFALDNYTGINVRRDDNCFKIEENSYRIKADVVPAWEYRKYRFGQTLATAGSLFYDEGVCFFKDDGSLVINWPEQDYSNGVSKNLNTSKRYNSVVRIVKRLRNEMLESGHRGANEMKSFQLESLIWNCPDWCFDGRDWHEIVVKVLRNVWYSTSDVNRCSNWTEVNGIKPLFDFGAIFDGKMAQTSSFFSHAMKEIGAS